MQIESPNPSKIYQRHDLEALNVLKNPVWVFDAQLKSMYWGNTAALGVWSAESLEELINRDFASDMSDATESRLQDYLIRFQRGEQISEQVCE
jgi:hypothetical protein